jgi:uncharacterized protein YjbJ (UPF0337 family)
MTARPVQPPQRPKGNRMNKDQVKGMAKEGMGKVQKKTGKMIGSQEHQAKGLAKEIEGKVQKNIGGARESIEDAGEKTRGSDDRR